MKIVFPLFSIILPDRNSTLFPYTTLFRSVQQDHRLHVDPHQEHDHRGDRAVDAREARHVAHVPRKGLEDALPQQPRSEEHTSELQSHSELVCRLLLEKKKNNIKTKID